MRKDIRPGRDQSQLSATYFSEERCQEEQGGSSHSLALHTSLEKEREEEGERG